MNILCKYEAKKSMRFFIFIYFFYLFVFLENHVLCATLWEMGPLREYNLYFQALKRLLFKNAPIFFFYLSFTANVTPLSLNIIKLIPLVSSTSKYNGSVFSMWLNEGVTRNHKIYEELIRCYEKLISMNTINTKSIICYQITRKRNKRLFCN